MAKYTRRIKVQRRIKVHRKITSRPKHTAASRVARTAADRVHERHRHVHRIMNSGKGKGVVFITGCGGRLGRVVAARILKEGYVVRGLVQSRHQLTSLPAGVVPFVGDIKDKELMANACDGANIVVHLAAIVSEYKSDTKRLISTNVEGTRSLLDTCERFRIEHFLFSSTVDVYGRYRNGVLTEQSALRPTDKYGYSKMLAERVINEYRASIESTVFRIATLYGPGFEESFFKVIRLIKEQKAYIIGNGQNRLALVHVSDAADAFGLAVAKRMSKGKTYNLSDGHEYTQQYLYNMVADTLGVPRPMRRVSPILVKVLAKSHGIDGDELRFLTSDRALDISLINRELGFSPKIGIKEGSYDMIRAYLATHRKEATATE